MRILQVTNIYYPELKFGGPPQKIHALSCGFVQRGHEVSVLTFHSERPAAGNSEMMDGVRVQYVPWAGRGLRQVPLKPGLLAAAVRESEIVHCYGLYDLLGPLAARYARRLDRPYLLEPLGMYVPRARNLFVKKVYHELFTARMAGSAAMIVAASPAEQEDLRPLAEQERLVIRRNGIDLAPFQKLPSGTAFRERHKISPESRIILYIGRISPIKNLEQLILAFERAALPESLLVLAGPMLEPDYEARIRTLLKTHSLEQQVWLPGPLFGGEKLAALAAAELFVLPSLSESFGNAAAEAVAAGVPVLLTDGCGIAPAINGRAGLAVPVGIDSLAGGLRQMMDRSQRDALTGRRAEVVQELSWAEPIRQTEELYQRILSARG